MIKVYVGEENVNVYISVSGTGPAGFLSGGVRDWSLDYRTCGAMSKRRMPNGIAQ